MLDDISCVMTIKGMVYDNIITLHELHVHLFHKVLHTWEHSCIVNIRITCILYIYKPEYLYTKDTDMF